MLGSHRLCIYYIAQLQVDAIPFVDLQNFPGVMELKRETDAHSDPIFIPRGLLFGNKRVASAYVS